MENKELKNTYDKIAQSWHEDHKADTWWQAGTNEFIARLKEGGNVLDVGCGGGTKSKYLSDSGFEVTGIDFSERFIDIAKEEVPTAKFLVMDAHSINNLKENFDGIFMQAVLLHVPKKDIEDILQKVVTKLNPEGLVYIAVKEKDKDGVDEEVKIEDDYGYEYERFFSYFTIDELRQHFVRVGLEMVYEERKSNWIQVIGRKKGNLFPLHTENGLTVEEEREILHDADEARCGINVSGPYSSVDEFLAALKKPEA
ncbi:MAG: class I SAM-dependent methyltransferase [bacterium]|nr:class I SAM-dependent methyltransferase [bacterium]